MGQSDLGAFEDGERPVSAEAEAVAGADEAHASLVETRDHRYPDADGTVDVAVMQVDYTVVGSGDDEYPVVHVFGRTRENDLVHVVVEEFRPYFYAPADAVTEGRLQEYDRITGWEYEDDGEVYESIRGERLVKIFGQTPRDVGRIRDDFDHYEADILFPNRFLIDKDVTSGVRVPRRETGDGRIRVHHEEVEPVDVQAEPRVNTFDIEVDDRSGFPEEGEQPILCLTSHDSYRDEYVVWLYESPASADVPGSLDGYEPIRGAIDVEVRSFDTEEAMLAAFLDYLEATDVDITMGWNFADFDAPYLIDRLDELDAGTDHDLDYNRLSRVEEVWRSDWQGPDVKGRVVFDLLYAYQRTQFTELDSYRLDDVGERELGVGKERYPGDIGDLWEDDPERLLEYNLRDVELCVELDRDQEIVAFWNEVRQFVGCKIEDATTPGDAVDMYVLHKLHGEYALPSKGQQAGEEYEGGAVFDPITGVRENVSVLDLKCFSGDTEVLTPDGAKNVREIEEGDPVYTLDPESFECEVDRVAETHAYRNRFGELHHLSGNTHDFKITENHRFLVSKKRGWDDQTPRDFEFREYRNLIDSERYAFPSHEPVSGRTPESFELVDEVGGGYVAVHCDEDLQWFRNRMPEAVTERTEVVHGSSTAVGLTQKVGKCLVPVEHYRENRETIERFADSVSLTYGRQHGEVPLSFGMDNWLRLIGWYVTEGSLDRADGRITLHRNDGEERAAIERLLDRMEISYSSDPRGLTVSNRNLVEWFADNCGEGDAEKRLPDWVFELDGEMLETLVETMIRGGGTRTGSGLWTFWTRSDALKTGIVDLAVRCGEKPTVSKQSDGTWYVSLGKRGSFDKSTDATVEDHDGSVYCLTAEDNHVVLAGRNGHYQWVGQSLYPMCMVTTNASPETKVDPEEYDGETYRAPNGTHFRKDPDGVIRGMVDELLSEREQKKALRNDHDPDTDAYEQYDRQQAAVKVIMNCFTPDTEVLTPAGIRNIRELEVGDEVYSLDPGTMEMEVKPVVETHAYPNYDGELVDIETSEIDFRVTPNHRMLVRTNDTNGITEDGWNFVEAGDLHDHCHYEMPHDWTFDHGDSLGETIDLGRMVRDETDTALTVADGGSKLAASHGRPNAVRRIPTDTFLQLLAWYITEGNVYEAESGDCRVGFAQSTDEKRAEIEALVETVVDHYHDSGRTISFRSYPIGDLFRKLCGDGSENRRIPELVFRGSKEQKELFLETLIEGDGDRQPNSWRYSTKSEKLRDDVLRLCTHLGLTASYDRSDSVWRIYCTENAENSFRMHRSGARSTAENGVYCVTVEDNGTLVAGRNGTFQNTSNSLYGVLGWDRFRLYDKEMGSAVTATGREVITFTEEVAAELDKEVVYGDTDSVMIELGSGVDREEAIEQSFELEERINGSYDEFALERLNAETHRFEIEFEKLYRRFFQAGKKKRYAGHIVWKEGKDVDDIDITGFEYQRSDIAPITKRVQREVIEMIVTGEDTETVTEYLHEVIADFQDGNVGLEDVGIPGGIGKRLDNYDTDTAQVRGAKYANAVLGTNFQRGSKPKRLYLDRVHSDFFERIEREEGLDPSTDPVYGEFRRNPDVICFEYPDQVPGEFEVDWEKMLDRTLRGPIERIIEALGISWQEVKSGQEQTGLGQFMS